MYVHMYVCTHTCMYICMYVRTYVGMLAVAQLSLQEGRIRTRQLAKNEAKNLPLSERNVGEIS